MPKSKCPKTFANKRQCYLHWGQH
ncbi:hypothetical protein MPLSOD_100386 [Mesorhizobium sp. SOD10]|nr:hypothetical protein MPLSOD_100386 [Mesorhizobium sp. SOD10]